MPSLGSFQGFFKDSLKGFRSFSKSALKGSFKA